MYTFQYIFNNYVENAFIVSYNGNCKIIVSFREVNIIKNEIYDKSKELILSNGIVFTMESLSKMLKISKKTIYKYYQSKEDIIKQIIDEARNDIKTQQKVLLQAQIDILEKIRGLLLIVPVNHDMFTSKNLKDMQIYYPDLAEYLKELYNQDWESMFKLLDQAKQLNLISCLDNKLLKDLYICGVMYSEREISSYQERLKCVVSIILEGIIIR